MYISNQLLGVKFKLSGREKFSQFQIVILAVNFCSH